MKQQDDEDLLDFQLFDCIIYPNLNIIKRSNSEQHIEPKAMLVLLALAAKTNTLISRQQLFDQVWPNSFSGNESLSRCISLLRSNLGESKDGHKFIETIPKMGYRLVAPVKYIGFDGTDNFIERRKQKPAIKRFFPLLIIITLILILAYTLKYTLPVQTGKNTGDNRKIEDPYLASIAVIQFVNKKGASTLITR